MAAATTAVSTTTTMKATTTAGVESAALMPDLAATVVKLGVMAFVVMAFPIVMNVEIGIIEDRKSVV